MKTAFTRLLLVCSIIPISGLLTAQTDTLRQKDLPGVEVIGVNTPEPIGFLPEIAGTVINAGKKNEVIRLGEMDADLSVNSTRQVFGRVPGISIWENDGSGIQVGVASRGLSPNRSWEFNTRQNGYDISSDVFGYPEAYYNPPMEALERIELVRGAGALQYGPQFGGLLNYIMKKGAANRKIAFETAQTGGSYGLFNSYNALGGTVGKWNYYTFYHQRSAEGWRDNSQYRTHTGYFSLNYSPSKAWTIGVQYTRMNFVSQQPGGLTDEQFEVNPRGSTRSRNWLGIPWNVASFSAEWKPRSGTLVTLKAFGILAERSSIGNLSGINTPDMIIDSLDAYSARQFDRDNYLNGGVELRSVQTYTLFGKQHHLSAGARIYRSEVQRIRATGSRGTDFDLSGISPVLSRDLEYTTLNGALFAENVFSVTKRFILIPGVRYEYLKNAASGKIHAEDGEFNRVASQRNVVLGGLAAEFHSGTTEFYGNYTMAYRPVTFSELTPSATTDVIDPGLKDAQGYNVDLGYRGTVSKRFTFDAGLFFMQYNNRIGSISRDGVIFRTNIGSSETRGAEVFASWNVIPGALARYGSLNVWTSLSFIDSRYTSWNDPSVLEDPSKDRVGKRVENAPRYIHRAGVNYSLSGYSVSLQYNLTGEAFSDALNTREANPSSTNGLVPAYEVWDINATARLNKQITLKTGVNNLTDAKYFTRRAGGYPGPGIMPGNGRTFYLTLAGNF